MKEGAGALACSVSRTLALVNAFAARSVCVWGFFFLDPWLQRGTRRDHRRVFPFSRSSLRNVGARGECPLRENLLSLSLVVREPCGQSASYWRSDHLLPEVRKEANDRPLVSVPLRGRAEPTSPLPPRPFPAWTLRKLKEQGRTQTVLCLHVALYLYVGLFSERATMSASSVGGPPSSTSTSVQEKEKKRKKTVPGKSISGETLNKLIRGATGKLASAASSPRFFLLFFPSRQRVLLLISNVKVNNGGHCGGKGRCPRGGAPVRPPLPVRPVNERLS